MTVLPHRSVSLLLPLKMPAHESNNQDHLSSNASDTFSTHNAHDNMEQVSQLKEMSTI